MHVDEPTFVLLFDRVNVCLLYCLDVQLKNLNILKKFSFFIIK